MEERGDIGIKKVFSLKNVIAYAKQNDGDVQKAIKQIIKQEKEWCEQSIFLSIKLHNLIDFDVKMDRETGEVSIIARLRGVVPPDKMEKMRCIRNPIQDK